MLWEQQGELEKLYTLYQKVGSAGPKFFLPLRDASQKLSYKRNAR